jgi:hypothetical protein
MQTTFKTRTCAALLAIGFTASALLVGCGGGGGTNPAPVSTPATTYPDALAVLKTDNYVVFVENDLSTQEVFWSHASGDASVIKSAESLYSLGNRIDKFDLKARAPAAPIAAPADAKSPGLNLPSGSGLMTGIAAGTNADTLYISYQTTANTSSFIEQYVAGQNLGVTKDTLPNLWLWGMGRVDNYVYGLCGNTELCFINAGTKNVQRLPYSDKNYSPIFQNSIGYSSAFQSTSVRRFVLSAGTLTETTSIDPFGGVSATIGNSIYAKTFTPDGKTLVATALESGYMALFDISTGQTTATVKLDTIYPEDVVATNDYIFVIGVDRTAPPNSYGSTNYYGIAKKLEVWKRSPSLQLVSSKAVKTICPASNIYYTADRSPRCSV